MDLPVLPPGIKDIVAMGVPGAVMLMIWQSIRELSKAVVTMTTEIQSIRKELTRVNSELIRLSTQAQHHENRLNRHEDLLTGPGR